MKSMFHRSVAAGIYTALAVSIVLHAQEFKVGSKTVQVHGFGTQGFIHTNDNNWLTMNTSGVGSGAFTDMGLNMGMQINSKLRIGGQFYDRKLGKLGDWEPLLDWAMLDYHPKPWFGFRVGKVKTVLGLFTDSQDMDFANTFALMPQSVYPIDLRDASISHEGGDIYGKERLPHKLGSVAYTAYGGRRADNMHSGYPYLMTGYTIYFNSYGGPVYGGDFRWKTPLRGLTVGISRLNEEITGNGMATAFLNPSGPLSSYSEYSKHDWTNQYYGQYTANRWHAESEYKRYYRDQEIFNGSVDNINDIRGWYVSGGFRVCKWFEGGSYYSHYQDLTNVGSAMGPTPDAATRDFDKVVTGKFTINQYFTIKVEGHFMAGYADEPYPNGFYSSVNPNGFADNTKALVVRTGFSF